MKKYRIKIVTFKNGRQLFYAQFKSKFWWTGLSCDGETGFTGKCETRERALARIDNHFKGNTTKQTIEFEYISQ